MLIVKTDGSFAALVTRAHLPGTRVHLGAAWSMWGAGSRSPWSRASPGPGGGSAARPSPTHLQQHSGGVQAREGEVMSAYHQLSPYLLNRQRITSM